MSPVRVPSQVLVQPDALRIEWPDGTTGDYASLWLRDNLAEHRDAHSGQRLVDVADLPAAPRLASARIVGGSIELTWYDEDKCARFDADWLYALARHTVAPEPQVRRWLEGGSLDAKRDFAWAALPRIEADPGARLDWLTRLLTDGLAFLSDVPPVDAGILAAMATVGRVAETNYGLVFDVRAVPQPENLAYSDVGLGLHTDNPYREPVPGFQALHTLIAAPDGGDSRFADGYALAEHLRVEAPALFDQLTRTPVPFRYRSAQAELYAERPLIELDCTGAVAAVHYNNRSIAPLALPLAACEAYYTAYRRWAGLLREPRFQLSLHLEAGELVLFDNRRVLHGRTGFASARHARHLRGCYLTRDSVHGAAALLRREQAARQPAT